MRRKIVFVFCGMQCEGTSKLSKHSGLYTLINTHTLLLDLFACIETYLSIKITGVGCDY